MKTDEIEKRIKRKLQPGKSLSEQLSKDEALEISFWTMVENIVWGKDQSRRIEDPALPPQTEKEFADQVKATGEEILAAHGNDLQKAHDSLMP